MIWSQLDKTTEGAEVWQRDASGQRQGVAPLGVLVRTVHQDGERIESAPVWVPGVSLAELANAGAS